jgi:hypothetical protein
MPETILHKTVFFLYDVYFYILDFYNSIFNPPRIHSFDHINNKEDNNATEYVIFDTENNIAFFSEYNGEYNQDKQFAFAGYFNAKHEFVDITDVMNMFSLDGAKLEFNSDTMQSWRNIFTYIHKEIPYENIEYFEFIDIKGNVYPNCKNFTINIIQNDFNIILHKDKEINEGNKDDESQSNEQ